MPTVLEMSRHVRITARLNYQCSVSSRNRVIKFKTWFDFRRLLHS